MYYGKIGSKPVIPTRRQIIAFNEIKKQVIESYKPDNDRFTLSQTPSKYG